MLVLLLFVGLLFFMFLPPLCIILLFEESIKDSVKHLIGFLIIIFWIIHSFLLVYDELKTVFNF